MKKLLSLLLIMLTLALSLTSCLLVPDKPADTDLEFWICQDVENFDFSGYCQKYGMFGGRQYYGLGYEPLEDPDSSHQIDPEHCVIYTVTGYPDHISSKSAITNILITDPNVSVWGLTVNSTAEEFSRAMKEQGFMVDNNEYYFYAHHGRVSVTLSKDKELQISYSVSNIFHIMF